MNLLRRLVPDGLAGRFALLLAAALIVVNLVAATLLSSERRRFGHEIGEARAIERLALIVPLIDAASPADRGRVADLAQDRFARVEIGPEPIVGPGETEMLATTQLRAALSALGSEPPELRARTGDGERGDRVLLSVRLDGPGQTWLNVRARPLGPAPPSDPVPFLRVLLLSLAAVLAVAVLFIRHLTRPLAALAAAARAAGRGDRLARVPEVGARELRESAHAFNEMQARIARFDAERTRTLAAVGHDLRTPITSLRIRAEMLDEADREPIVRTLDEMTVMADSLVAYARGQADVEASSDLDLAALLARLCEERGAAMTPTPPLMVRGRPVALSRAFGNLIDNALRYGGAARARLERRGAEAVATIEDDGPGIPAGRIEAMFEPFVRGEASRNADTGGAGLGLSIARGIVGAHGGELRISNRPEGGLRAEVLLPLAH